MADDSPSRTALSVARRRAAHQVLDEPVIFEDPLAFAILGIEAASALGAGHSWLDQSPFARILRASLAARSRFAEDCLHAAVREGTGQYVLLGAGLDTFACRNPYPVRTLRVFEVDRPAVQQWKRVRLAAAGLTVPPSLIFAPVDFEAQSLGEGLRLAGFDSGQPAFFSWLGVTMYLSEGAIEETLRLVAAMPGGSGIVFDYMLAPSLLGPEERANFDGLARRVALAGEPFQAWFDPPALTERLQSMGFGQIEDIHPDAMNSRYFQGRTDGLRFGRLAHVMHAVV